MKRNGFTLIELLAVIVIFAIIALIVTPIIANKATNKGTKYKKVVCYYGQEVKEFNIDKLIYNLDTEIKIENNGKIYELRKNNCYLIADK